MKNPCYDIHVSSTYDLCYDPGVLSERMTFYIIKVNYLNKDNIILKLRINLPNILAPLNNRWWKQFTLYKMFQVIVITEYHLCAIRDIILYARTPT